MKKIPFYNYVVTKDNFNDVEDFENISITIKRVDNGIKIEFKNSIPANMHYYEKDGYNVYCFDEEILADYLREHSIELTENENWKYYMSQEGHKKDGELHHNHYNEIKRIALYEYLIVTPEKIETKEITGFFSVDILDAGPIIKRWIERYTKIIDQNYNNIVADLSAGLDTRSLTYFWRGKNIFKIYTKNDPDEIPIVQELHEKYFKDIRLTIGEESEDSNLNLITLSGKGADLFAVRSRFLDPKFYEECICFINFELLCLGICPYLDKEFVKIKPEYSNQLKIVMQYLLAGDIMDVPYKSFRRDDFSFTDDMEIEAKRIISYWGL